MAQRSSKYINIYTYTLLYATFGILSSSYHACFTASLTTLEKRYHFSSTIAGYVMITDNIASLFTAIIVGCYAGTAHKPKWMSVACAISGLSVMITALPYFLFGAAEKQELEYIGGNVTLSKIHSSRDQLCLIEPIVEDCKDVVTTRFITLIAVVCFSISNFFRGFGTTIFVTYGLPYLDDNIKKTQMPAFSSVVFGARMFGAPIGYGLTAWFLRLYENPLNPPSDLSNSDPRWVGAWWIGFLATGTSMLLLSIPISFFPKELKKKKPISNQVEGAQLVTGSTSTNGNLDTVRRDKLEEQASDDTSLAQLPGKVYEIIRNPLIACQMLGNIARGLGLAGYFVFQSRYLESEFKQPAAKASLLAGTTGILPKVIGVVSGGLFISLFQPRARKLTTFLFIVELTSVFGLLYVSTIQGPIYSHPFTSMNKGLLDLKNECNRKCNCDHVKYQPVCEYSGTGSYFSPCHAGCNMSFKVIDGGSTFTGCDCIQSNTKSLETCTSDSKRLTEYVLVVAAGVMIAGSARSGNIVTMVRSVEPDQKSLTIAIQNFIYSLLVAIPYPLIYGRLFDSYCLVWSKGCGKRGNCWLYDSNGLRKSYHFLSICLIALGSCFDFIMIFLSPRLKNLYSDDGKQSSMGSLPIISKLRSRIMKKSTTDKEVIPFKTRASKPEVTSL